MSIVMINVNILFRKGNAHNHLIPLRLVGYTDTMLLKKPIWLEQAAHFPVPSTGRVKRQRYDFFADELCHSISVPKELKVLYMIRMTNASSCFGWLGFMETADTKSKMFPAFIWKSLRAQVADRSLLSGCQMNVRQNKLCSVRLASRLRKRSRYNISEHVRNTWKIKIWKKLKKSVERINVKKKRSGRKGLKMSFNGTNRWSCCGTRRYRVLLGASW